MKKNSSFLRIFFRIDPSADGFMDPADEQGIHIRPVRLQLLPFENAEFFHRPAFLLRRVENPMAGEQEDVMENQAYAERVEEKFLPMFHEQLHHGKRLL
jgi:hypothetical protein